MGSTGERRLRRGVLVHRSSRRARPGGGSEYDQSHKPVVEQRESVGHAVRFAYSIAGMADIALATDDSAYHDATLALYHNTIGKKYHVTGGIGSVGSNEGFGPNYELPHSAYSETCAGCGLLFVGHRMNRAHHDAAYASLFEETLYNVILGSLDSSGDHFTYTNPLYQTHERYEWHGCPCCVGNIPRTLLKAPTWAYQRSDDGVWVNLYFGSTVTIDDVAGGSVELAQRTNYPWDGAVAITVTPDSEREFTLRLRTAAWDVSPLYTATPAADGLKALTVNGEAQDISIENGYAVVRRTWRRGDQVTFELPMAVQRVHADERIAATRGQVALRRGPLLLNVEAVDQPIDFELTADAPLTPRWKAELLNGVVVIEGKTADGDTFQPDNSPVAADLKEVFHID